MLFYFVEWPYRSKDEASKLNDRAHVCIFSSFAWTNTAFAAGFTHFTANTIKNEGVNRTYIMRHQKWQFQLIVWAVTSHFLQSRTCRNHTDLYCSFEVSPTSRDGGIRKNSLCGSKSHCKQHFFNHHITLIQYTMVENEVVYRTFIMRHQKCQF